MSYDFKTWRKRHIERSDLTTGLAHLTRSVKGESSAIEVLYNILESGIINGSTTESGFIVGDIPAVCLQDAPLYAIGQNCWFEQTWREENNWAKKRYDATGLIFKKKYVYFNDGRPAIYDATIHAKKYLPEDNWWRIVNFDLSDSKNIIDWTHEREWRVPHQLKFNPEDVALLFANNSELVSFIELCDELGNRFYKSVRGMSTMESLIC
jgi:hypothetical protein